MSKELPYPLTPEQFFRLEDRLLHWPHQPHNAWMAHRNVAILWFIVTMATRAEESSKYYIRDIYLRSGLVRPDLPIDCDLQTGHRERHGWQPVDVPVRLAEVMQTWHQVYTAVLGDPPKPEFPLWLSYKHTTVMQGLERESLWRALKPAALACGVHGGILEVLRNTALRNSLLAEVTGDELQRVMQAMTRVQQRMRHRSIKDTWVKAERIWRLRS